jgi:hypothetical protein
VHDSIFGPKLLFFEIRDRSLLVRREIRPSIQARDSDVEIAMSRFQIHEGRVDSLLHRNGPPAFVLTRCMSLQTKGQLL